MPETGYVHEPEINEALDELKSALFYWYISPVLDRDAERDFHNAAMQYAYAVYGELSDEDRAAELSWLRRRRREGR